MLFVRKVNLSTPRPKGRGLLEVHPELRLLPHLKGGASRSRTGEPEESLMGWAGKGSG
jgi:hypothetical protein